MEEDGDGGEDLTPFWLQSNANLPRAHQLRLRASSVFLSSGLVVFLLLVTAVIFLVFVVPSTLSLSSQIFKPNSVKKSWDSLNVLLVLVAVVFGFLSKNKDEDRYSFSYYGENQESIDSKKNETQKSNPSTPHHWYNSNTIQGEKSNLSSSDRWYDYPDFESKVEYKNPILRKNSSSYPDLREFSSTRWAHEDFHRRFEDDMNVGTSRVVDPGQLHRRHRSLEEVDYLRVPSQTKTVFVDTLVNKSTLAGGFPRSSHPPPYQPVLPSSQSLGLQEKPNRAQETSVARKERSRRKIEKEMETLHTVSAERTPPPPPPPPPPQQNRSKSDRKRGGSGGNSSATKDFLNSLYHKKKKKQRQKSVDNLDFLLHQTEAPLSFQLPPSSPPSPQPPSVFQNLFSSKKHKRKRTITVTVKSPSPAPPPTPPEPPTPRNAEPEQNASSREAPFAIHKPENFENLAENSNGGGESPLNRVPPPPPLPPFLKKPAWKFVVQGDYVRLDSVNSSRSGSSDLDELDSDNASETGNVTAPTHPASLFCPSPDVNSKAESFITNFRAKLKLERHHSVNKSRELGLSSLGPGPGPSQI
ncbi:uncharacterized protein LOC142511590 [Primulina tabacum]|uniref:uncharacterized protein LOC142511590 n=1 Tax=Primulina tabacum TaxID=48773 RepID=UPI003F5961AB